MNIHRSGVLSALAWLVPQETAAVSVHVLCTPYNCAPCYFMQSHIHKVYACLAVTCHLRFWQNDRDFLHATAITQGWNGYQNKSAQKADLGEENSPAAPAGIQTCDLSITSPTVQQCYRTVKAEEAEGTLTQGPGRNQGPATRGMQQNWRTAPTVQYLQHSSPHNITRAQSPSYFINVRQTDK